MKKFVTRFLLFILIPIIGLGVLYFLVDPYKTLKPFSSEYFDTANRDYLSSELFLYNYQEQGYNSFIFSSSRGCGINTYHWKKYLPDNAHPFLFQAWSETLTGIEQKVTYLNEHQIPINSALVLIDIPGTFAKEQIPTALISIKDPTISRQPKWKHQFLLLYNFMQKPSQWVLALQNRIPPNRPSICFDVITNDWDKTNKYADISSPPAKDSLKNMSKTSRNAFLNDIKWKSDKNLEVSMPVINDSFVKQLEHIKLIFEANGTDYRIIITPHYCYTHSSIAPSDLLCLREIFGEDKVFDYSGKNELTKDYNNFSDSNHFGQYVGWHVIEDIYNHETLNNHH